MKIVVGERVNVLTNLKVRILAKSSNEVLIIKQIIIFYIDIIFNSL